MSPHRSLAPVERVRVPGVGSFLALVGLRREALRSILVSHERNRDDERILKERFGTRVTRVSIDPRGEDAALLGTAEVVVKEARVPGRRRIAQRLGWPARAHGEFAQESRLANRRIATPRVLACTLRSPHRSEFTLTAFVEGGRTLRQLLWLDGGVLTTRAERLELLAHLGLWIRHLHEAGVWQRDLKAHNIMIRRWSEERPDLLLLDVTAVRFLSKPLDRARRVRNLGQVLDVPEHLDDELAEPLLRAYLADASDAALWLREVRDATEVRREGRLRKDGFRFIDERILSRN